ncbi:uncharacterized protein LOC110236853 isoform X2 [Exaiptasia diaphana]|uniref:Uncharacterized protein n=1 Tax=Exaiptasia diaphana TaxID=2652724 RepID=A0A913X317_EXADI|nr:uncharacterized protein LOC110236853 isoform X1 [Exaiptasia diaphana]XP_020898070.1 uncharacterized protein LOC110236853 isoform X1 [Exaiptasia diaphana]XP_020898071.1 uncharacterized protein LOC110236853 isoform X1 [Exaiptasia diaphana]XP_020898072.1 uncharacterized protein LOC110236853 isoform X2 [Exaiptasia diaphana]KXJ15809.1 hypothetical protein AC249_AIPGENE11995 [Exaiptasia diaphana]
MVVETFVLALILLVILLIVLMVCVKRQGHKKSNEEIAVKGLKRQSLEYSEYEVMPAISKTQKTTVNYQSEYKALDPSKITTRNQEYASLSVITSTSKSSLASITSGHDVKTSDNSAKSKRQGIVISSLSVDRRIPSASQGEEAASSKQLPVCKPKPSQTIDREKLKFNQQQTPALSRKRNNDGTAGSFKPAIRPKPDCKRLKKPQHRYENAILNN